MNSSHNTTRFSGSAGRGLTGLPVNFGIDCAYTSSRYLSKPSVFPAVQALPELFGRFSRRRMVDFLALPDLLHDVVEQRQHGQLGIILQCRLGFAVLFVVTGKLQEHDRIVGKLAVAFPQKRDRLRSLLGGPAVSQGQRLVVPGLLFHLLEDRPPNGNRFLGQPARAPGRSDGWRFAGGNWSSRGPKRCRCGP